MTAPPTARTQFTLVIVCAAALALFTVHYQVRFMGLAWFEQVQWERTCQVMANESGTPWQYRLFTDGIVYGTVRAFQALHVPRPIGTAFVLIRLLQNTLAFTLAVAWYRRLGLSLMEGLFGIMLLAWGMCHALYDGDLTFNTYTDMSLFLAAALLIIDGRHRWLIPLMVITPLNRETSGCIPVMLLFSRFQWRERPRVSREVLVIAALCLAQWAVIVGGLRLLFGVKPYIVPTAGESPILPLLTFNLTWPRTWIFLFCTLGLVPLLAMTSWRGWHPTLRRFFFAVVPVWFPVHFCLAHAPETRLFLVPHALIFIPGALAGIAWWGAGFREAARPVNRT